MKANFTVDLVLFSLFLVGSEPSLTGNGVHEWVNVALAAIALSHLLMHGNWITVMTGRQRRRRSRFWRLNYHLDLGLAVSFVTVVLSGLMISRVIVGAPGLMVSDHFVWREVHSFFANLLIFLVGLHFALHWRWIGHACTRYLTRSFGGASQTRTALIESSES